MLKQFFLTVALSSAAFADVESLESRVKNLLANNNANDAETVLTKELKTVTARNKKRAEQHEKPLDTSNIHALLSTVYLAQGKPDLAVHEIGLARAEQPDSIIYREQQMTCFYDVGLYNSCVDAADELEKLLPENDRAFVKKKAAHAHKNLADAQYFRRFMPMRPNITPWPITIEHYTKALEHPDFATNDEVYARRGTLSFETNKNDDALADFTKALTLSPKNPSHYENITLSLQRANRLGDLISTVSAINGYDEKLFCDAASETINQLLIGTTLTPSIPELQGYLKVALQPNTGTIELFEKIGMYQQKEWLRYLSLFGKQEAEQDPRWCRSLRFAHIAGALAAAKAFKEGKNPSEALEAFVKETMPIYQPLAKELQLAPVTMITDLDACTFENKELVLELLNPQRTLDPSRYELGK